MLTESKAELFGHPKGLFVLFSTELWERFSFYSMRGILTLYIATVVLAGQGDAGAHADHIYGAYLGFVYGSTFIGGMLADRLLGQRRAIYIGGILMALAQFTLATHALLVRGGHAASSLHWMFFLGLGLLSSGNGFFKPNISTIVGTLYERSDGRRDAAFTIFYMGINIGAFLASFSGQIAQTWGWYLGYALAGSGMILGLLIFIFGLGPLAGKGLPPAGASLVNRGRFGVPNFLPLLIGVGIYIPLASFFISRPEWVQNMALFLAVPVVAYLLWEAARTGGADGGRMVVILVLCSFSMMFWGFFELAGSTITRFTDESVNRVVFGFELKAAFLGNVVNPLFIIIFSVFFSALWVWLARRKLEPSSPLKFAFGLGSLALGFVMLYLGALRAQSSGKAAMIWLVLGYFFHTTGELCLSPVGLSTITKLSPTKFVGMFMGVWFLSSALGNVLAPKVAGIQAGQDFAHIFLRIALIAFGGCAVLLILVVPLKRMMHGVK